MSKLRFHALAIMQPYFVWNKRVKVLDDLPKNASGEIDRIALQRMASGVS